MTQDQAGQYTFHRHNKLFYRRFLTPIYDEVVYQYLILIKWLLVNASNVPVIYLILFYGLILKICLIVCKMIMNLHQIVESECSGEIFRQPLNWSPQSYTTLL